MQWELTILTVWWNHGWKSRSWQLSPYEQQRSKTNDSNTELHWYSSWSYNAVFWAHKLTTEVMFHKKNRKVYQDYWVPRLQWFTLLSKHQSPALTAVGLFKGVVIYRRNFTININSSLSSTEAWHIKNKLIIEWNKYLTLQTTTVHFWHRKSQLRWKANCLFLSSISCLFSIFLVDWILTEKQFVFFYKIVML